MGGKLRVNDIRDWLLAGADYGSRRLVARTLDAEDVNVVHTTIVRAAEGAPSGAPQEKVLYMIVIPTEGFSPSGGTCFLLSFPEGSGRRAAATIKLVNAGARHQHRSRVARARLSGLFRRRLRARHAARRRARRLRRCHRRHSSSGDAHLPGNLRGGRAVRSGAGASETSHRNSHPTKRRLGGAPSGSS